MNGLDRDTPRILYRLPDILAADPGLPVFLVEGERKADRLADWCMIATAVAFGAKGWRDDYATALEGRTVVILPDNDDEGRGFAARALKSIEAAGARGVIIALPGLPTKGDIIDWSGNGRSAFELSQLVDAALNPPARLLTYIDAGDLAGRAIEPREFMTAGLEPRGSATYLTGVGASGKSLLTQQRMTCSAAGLPFLGVDCRPGVSIYITCEDSEAELHRRQDSINTALGVSWDQLRGRLFLVSLKGMLSNEFCTFDAESRMRTTPRWEETVATIKQVGATHVALDNVAHLFTGNENIRNQVAAFTGLVDRLAQDINGGVLLLGHPNKAGDEFSGSTAWENQVRARLYLALDNRDDGAGDPDVRVLTNSKPNYSRRGESITFRWHQWAFQLEDDLPSSAGAELAANIAANADNDIFLACLAERTKQQRAVSELRSPAFAPTVFAKMPESKRVGKARLEAAMDRLFRTGRIERAELWRGADRKPVFGLRETAGNGAANTVRATRATGPEMADCLADDAPNTHTIPKGISAAPLGVSAADHEEEGGSAAGYRPILAPGESITDPIPGWPE